GCRARESPMWQKFFVEIRKFGLIAAFLFFFFGAFATYRRLILREYQIDYFQYGYSLIEALVLGKVILLGDLFHLGDRFRGKPLIVPTLYRTFAFSILVLAFAVLEHLVKGFIHGDSAAVVLAEIASTSGAEIVYKIVLFFFAFIPFFEVGEIRNLFEGGKLFELFFERGTPVRVLPGVAKAAPLQQSGGHHLLLSRPPAVIATPRDAQA